MMIKKSLLIGMLLSLTAGAHAESGPIGMAEHIMNDMPAPWDMAGWMGVMAGIPAGDVKRGEALDTKAYCYTCHGDKGVPPSRNAPRLAGQDKTWLFKALHDYKSGRMHIDNKSLGMHALTQPLSEQDMADLAAYYSAQAAPSGATGAPPIEAAGCMGCHQANGAAGLGGSGPGLGGQSTEYLVRQLKAFRAGTRTSDVGGMMRGLSGALSDQQIEQIANFYAGK